MLVAHYMPPTNYHLLTAQQEPYKNAQLSLDEKYENCVGGKNKISRGNELFGEKWQNGKSTDKEQKQENRMNGKGNRKTAPRFPDTWKTLDIPSLPSGWLKSNQANTMTAAPQEVGVPWLAVSGVGRKM